jgi:hypothetical protein
MRACCPESRGCNAPDGDQPCALELFAACAADLEEAAVALARWSVFQHECEHGNNDHERRFRRRAYERARDDALIALALHDPGSDDVVISDLRRRRAPDQTRS